MESKCPYCGALVVLRDNSVVYRHTLGSGKVWICSRYPECDAYVGVHKGTTRALGRLADRELRALKMQCHRVFDRQWLDGAMTRSDAYRMLQYVMGMTEQQAHIGKFSAEECRQMLDAFGGDK